jgi:hypothetical protein
MPEDLQERRHATAVLPADGGDHHAQEPAAGVDHERPRAPFPLLRRVNTRAPPGAVVLTDGLSIIPALGWRRWPAAARPSPRTRACSPGQVPSWHQGRTS